jgi:hypothetical protein
MSYWNYQVVEAGVIYNTPNESFNVDLNTETNILDIKLITSRKVNTETHIQRQAVLHDCLSVQVAGRWGQHKLK